MNRSIRWPSERETPVPVPGDMEAGPMGALRVIGVLRVGPDAAPEVGLVIGVGGKATTLKVILAKKGEKVFVCLYVFVASVCVCVCVCWRVLICVRRYGII